MQNRVETLVGTHIIPISYNFRFFSFFFEDAAHCNQTPGPSHQPVKWCCPSARYIACQAVSVNRHCKTIDCKLF
jgi:hypothetical protein